MAQFGDQTLRTAIYRERMHFAWLSQQEEARIRREAAQARFKAERTARHARMRRATKAWGRFFHFAKVKEHEPIHRVCLVMDFWCVHFQVNNDLINIMHLFARHLHFWHFVQFFNHGQSPGMPECQSPGMPISRNANLHECQSPGMPISGNANPLLWIRKQSWCRCSSCGRSRSEAPDRLQIGSLC